MGSWKVMSTWASLARDTISESFTTWGRTDGFMKNLLRRHDNTASLPPGGVDCPLVAIWSKAQSQIYHNRLSTPTLTQHFPKSPEIAQCVCVCVCTILAASSRSSQARIFRGLAAIRALASSTRVPSDSTRSLGSMNMNLRFNKNSTRQRNFHELQSITVISTGVFSKQGLHVF